jgi:hypothetical protein
MTDGRSVGQQLLPNSRHVEGQLSCPVWRESGSAESTQDLTTLHVSSLVWEEGNIYECQLRSTTKPGKTPSLSQGLSGIFY